MSTTSSLTPVDTCHLDLIRGWIADEELRDLLGTVRPPSDVEHQRWFEAIQADPTRETRVITAGSAGEPVGLVGLLDVDLVYRSAELWLYIGDPAHRRSGLGRSATLSMLTFAFHTLGLERVFVRVAAFNEPAHRFFRSLGFTDEGTLRRATFKRGAFHDMHLLSMLSDELPASEERNP